MGSKTIFCSTAKTLTLGAVLLCNPAWALYKVVGPDGKVSYTDRPPTSSNDKVTGLSPTGGTKTADSDSAAAPLPLALRQVTAKFPVVLYVSTPDCEPCNTGRQLLQQRGIPYSERTVTTTEDAAALQRLTGGKQVPTLSVGAQVLSGFSAGEWRQYLDAAGYPATSTLPAGYQTAAATPLVPPRATAISPSPRVVAPAPETRSPAAASTAPGGIRF